MLENLKQKLLLTLNIKIKEATKTAINVDEINEQNPKTAINIEPDTDEMVGGKRQKKRKSKKQMKKRKSGKKTRRSKK